MTRLISITLLLALGAACGGLVDGDGDGATGTDDCNDKDAAIGPAATERCDSAGTDEDCDGLVNGDDPSLDVGTAIAAWPDADEDGFGDFMSSRTNLCALAAGFVDNKDDCDDGDAAINPDATEVCDDADVDENCNGLTTDAPTRTLWPDDDGDGYGDMDAAAVETCAAAAGLVDEHTDCDDNEAAIHPGADEVCDAANTDEDCDRTADNADTSTTAASKVTVWTDGDRDGYGSGDPLLACDPMSGQASVDGDCDDSTSAVNPDATEVCDGSDRDEDCNGLADDNDAGVAPGGMRSVYPDGDGDGHAATNASAIQRCDGGAGFVTTRDDCDDTTATRAPGNQEVCDAANTDEDCDNLADDADSSVSAASKTTFYDDGDRDGYGELAVTFQRCDASNSASADATDCNDGDAAVHPGADEVCDQYVGGRDEDCDGLKNDADPSTTQASMQGGYLDADGDGQGDENDAGTFACVITGDYVDNNTDCDDARPGIYTSPISGLCSASITDVNSPYYENVCDFSQYQTNPSNLIIDCRCAFNARVADQCVSPQTIRADHTIGAGPTMRGALGDTTIGGGGPDITTGEIIYAFNWDDGPNDEGMVWGVDYDTGDRRIISGRYLDARAGFVEYGTGPHLDHAVDLEVGPDGYYYLVSVAPNADEEIFKVDPATGNRTLAWRENDAAWAQCDNGANGPLQTVQVNSLGFEVGDDGSFYFGIFIFGGSNEGQGPSVIKISPDGQTCSYVTRYGAGSSNRFYGQNIGGGYPLSQGRYEGFEWVDGFLYAQDFVSQAIYRINPVNGDRYVITSSTDHVGTGPAIGTRWVVHDPVRDLLWTSGLSPNPADIYSVHMTTGNRLDLTCFSPYLDSWDYCSEGPAATYAIQDSGIFVHPFTGDLIAGHTGYSFVKMEPDTGNSNTFSF
jgi:hypothetical protein